MGYHSPVLLMGSFFFVIFVSHLLARYGFSLAWSLAMLPVVLRGQTLVVNRTVRARVRQVEAEVRATAFPEHESVEWINHLLAMAWSNFSLAIAELGVAQMQQKLDSIEAPGISKLMVTNLNLGKRPPYLGNFKVFQGTATAFVMEMGWSYSKCGVFCVLFFGGLMPNCHEPLNNTKFHPSDIRWDSDFRVGVTATTKVGM